MKNAALMHDKCCVILLIKFCIDHVHVLAVVLLNPRRANLKLHAIRSDVRIGESSLRWLVSSNSCPTACDKHLQLSVGPCQQ